MGLYHNSDFVLHHNRFVQLYPQMYGIRLAQGSWDVMFMYDMVLGQPQLRVHNLCYEIDHIMIETWIDKENSGRHHLVKVESVIRMHKTRALDLGLTMII
jgi:hypothetical protein